MRGGFWRAFSGVIAAALICSVSPVVAQDLIPAKRLTLSENTDLPGGDLASIFDTTLEACERACLTNNKCEAFTFNTRNGSCFPKANAGAAAAFDGAYSGFVLKSADGAVDRAKARRAELKFVQDWEISGINNRVASMIATGTLSPRPSRKPNAASHQSAIAMLINRRTGALLTDASDAFSDQMESARSTYCAHLDIQRIANALDADPSAGSAGKPRILDEKGRYLGKWHCPYFGDLAVGFSGPVDQPLDHIVLLAEPGIAGPEHEGYYRVQLAITPTILANVRPEFREAFRATDTCKDCDVEKHEQ